MIHGPSSSPTELEPNGALPHGRKRKQPGTTSTNVRSIHFAANPAQDRARGGRKDLSSVADGSSFDPESDPSSRTDSGADSRKRSAGFGVGGGVGAGMIGAGTMELIRDFEDPLNLDMGSEDYEYPYSYDDDDDGDGSGGRGS